MSSLKLIGPTQYKNLLAALDYYERAGYKYVDVPWGVGRDAILLTRPAHITCEPVNYEAGGAAIYPVASAEQSFIQMKLDDPNFSGKLVTLTPCFRNEPTLDELHQPYFMKVELINWDKTGREDIDKMIADARLLFEEQLYVDVIHNTDPDPLGTVAYDIVTAKTGIELGSYGIRSHPKVGTWLYGTGLAEPRFSIALDKEPQIEAFF
jgi:hypothetical protein